MRAVLDPGFGLQRSLQTAEPLRETRIHARHQALLGAQPHDESEQRQTEHQRHGVPHRQPQADGNPVQVASEHMEYPTPRSVRMVPGWPDSSTLARRRRTNASNVLLSMSESPPQTLSMRESRETTRPALRISTSRIAYSVRVRAMPRCPRQTSRAP